MLEDENAEVRRGSAVACGLKGEKQLVPNLITCLADKETPVVHAAHGSLKSLSSKDFGPLLETDDAEKARSIIAWRNWWKTQQK